MSAAKTYRRLHLSFYCSALQLTIEIDGDSAEREEYDAERTRFLNACGITVLRYSNHDVFASIYWRTNI
ncbi:MAG: DUF559 domain-containing protein [Pseudomonadales bacterium]